MKKYLCFVFIIAINGCSQWSHHSEKVTNKLPALATASSITSSNNAYQCSPEVVRYDRC